MGRASRPRGTPERIQRRLLSEEQNYKGVYCKVPKFSDTGKLCCNLPKIETKSTIIRVFSQEDANGIANSEDPDQTAPLGAV